MIKLVITVKDEDTPYGRKQLRILSMDGYVSELQYVSSKEHLDVLYAMIKTAKLVLNKAPEYSIECFSERIKKSYSELSPVQVKEATKYLHIFKDLLLPSNRSPLCLYKKEEAKGYSKWT